MNRERIKDVVYNVAVMASIAIVWVCFLYIVLLFIRFVV